MPLSYLGPVHLVTARPGPPLKQGPIGARKLALFDSLHLRAQPVCGAVLERSISQPGREGREVERACPCCSKGYLETEGQAVMCPARSVGSVGIEEARWLHARRGC